MQFLIDKIRLFFSELKIFVAELKSNPEKRKLFLRKLSIYSASAIAVIIAMVVLLIFSVWAGLFGKLPGTHELALVENQLSSEIYAQKGQLLGKYFIYDRSHANQEQISEIVYNALIATEDARFYNHKGIDYQSLGRVFIKSLLLQQKSAGGGSTISQQLAKNLFLRNNNGILSMPVNKIREMIIAKRLERVYSKDEILVLYLNTVPFGENVFGISSASLRFFNKNPLDLKIEEAAVLIGMLKATSYFNPRLQPERAIGRRNVVIRQLLRYEYIEKQAADSLIALPLKLDYNPITHNQGPAPYFRETIRLQIDQLLAEYNVKNNTDYNLYTDGLKIYTTINYNLQLMAEAAIKSQLSRQQKSMDAFYKNASAGRANSLLKSLMRNSERYKTLKANNLTDKQIEENFSEVIPMEIFSWDGPAAVEISPIDSLFKMQQILHAGLVSIDPSNGHVRAWVGGNDFRFFQYDHVLSKRQAGSTFKPFLYATALKMGIDPCAYVSNEQKIYSDYDDWSPANAKNEYGGYYSMTGALANSINTVSAHYIGQTGVLPVIETLRLSGIKSSLPPVPSLALGTANVSLLELTAAYSVFLNEGTTVEPIWLLKIEDKEGKILYERKQKAIINQAISPEVALMTRQMMQAVADSGTAGSLRYIHGLYGSIAGKTGTTQNNADTWFVGFTPGLITGVWTGIENPGFAQIYKTPMGSVSSAVPVWGEYHRQMTRYSSTNRFVAGTFNALPDSLTSLLTCKMYLDELPPDNWWDAIFKTEDGNEPGKTDENDRDKKRGNFRKWLENLF
jgi:penicillin-binding protein 1A